MPVVKNDYNIYKSNRNRRVSECSNDKASSTSSATGGRRLHGGSRSAEGPSSLSTSPGSDFMVGSSPAHRSLGGMSRQSASHHHTGSQHHGVASRNSSRNSQSSLQSPAKSSSTSSSPPPKLSSTSSLNMFHSKLVDKLRRSLTSKSKDSEYRLSVNFLIGTNLLPVVPLPRIPFLNGPKGSFSLISTVPCHRTVRFGYYCLSRVLLLSIWFFFSRVTRGENTSDVFFSFFSYLLSA